MKFDLEGWFHEHTERRLRELIQEHDIKSVIEIGGFVGKSTAFFARECGRVTVIDPFTLWEEGRKNAQASKFGEDFYDQFRFNLATLGLWDKVHPIRETSAQAALLHPNLRADLVYIDGAHDYDNVAQDIAFWGPRADKIVCGDDYDDSWVDVRRAVDEVYPQAEVYINLWIAPIMGI